MHPLATEEKAATASSPTRSRWMENRDDFLLQLARDYGEAAGMLSLAAADAEEEASQLALLRAEEWLVRQAGLCRSLTLPLSPGPIALRKHLETICRRLSKVMLAERGISLALKTDESFLPSRYCWHADLIVSELVRAAASHGLAGRQGSILVELAVGKGHLLGAVTGSNLAAGVQPIPAALRHRSEELARDCGGSLRWDSWDKRLAALFAIPLSEGVIL